jgi:Helicase HerA, central domain
MRTNTRVSVAGYAVHRIVLMTLAIVATSDSALRTHSWWELTGALFTGGMSIPIHSGNTTFDYFSRLIKFTLKPKQLRIEPLRFWWEVPVIGRSDIGGLAGSIVRMVEQHARTVSAFQGGTVVIRIVDRAARRMLLVGSTHEMDVPASWISIFPEVVETALGRNQLVCGNGLYWVGRVVEMRGEKSTPLLKRFEMLQTPLDLAVTVTVMSEGSALRKTRRRAHGQRSTQEFLAKWGFEHDVRAAHQMEQTGRQERSVVSGNALLHVSITTAVVEQTQSALIRSRLQILQSARQSGLVLDNGWCLQGGLIGAHLGGVSRHAGFRITSDELGCLSLPSHDGGTHLRGRSLGTCARGTKFVFDPFDAYNEHLITNPNMVVTGAIGTGKSTFIKMMLQRTLERGRSAVIVDPKGEYAQMAKLQRGVVVQPGEGQWFQLFDTYDETECDLFVAALRAAADAPFYVEEMAEIIKTWREVACSHEPLPFQFARDRWISTPNYSRLAAAAFRLTEGDLRNVVDGAGLPLNFESRLTVIDISNHIMGSLFPLIGLIVVATSLQLSRSGRQSLLVIDEAWSVLNDAFSLTWLRSSWKLARARGISHAFVVHRLGDTETVGEANSATRKQAEALLHECETWWIFRQASDDMKQVSRVVGLTKYESDIASSLPRGICLARYGPYRSVVHLLPDRIDLQITDTDARMKI